MRNLIAAVLALLILSASFSPSAFAAGAGGCADPVSLSDDASIRADGDIHAGSFIKPEAPVRALAERSEAPPRLIAATAAEEQRGSGPFSPKSLLSDEPAPSSASVRRALLHVYRL